MDRLTRHIEDFNQHALVFCASDVASYAKDIHQIAKNIIAGSIAEDDISEKILSLLTSRMLFNWTMLLAAYHERALDLEMLTPSHLNLMVLAKLVDNDSLTIFFNFLKKHKKIQDFFKIRYERLYLEISHNPNFFKIDHSFHFNSGESLISRPDAFTGLVGLYFYLLYLNASWIAWNQEALANGEENAEATKMRLLQLTANMPHFLYTACQYHQFHAYEMAVTVCRLHQHQLTESQTIFFYQAAHLLSNRYQAPGCYLAADLCLLISEQDTLPANTSVAMYLIEAIKFILIAQHIETESSSKQATQELYFATTPQAWFQTHPYFGEEHPEKIIEKILLAYPSLSGRECGYIFTQATHDAAEFLKKSHPRLFMSDAQNQAPRAPTPGLSR